MLKKGQPAAAVYDLIFGLNFLEPRYSLLFQDTQIEQLSPGQRGALLLIFYLLVDKGKTPSFLISRKRILTTRRCSVCSFPFSLKPKQRQIIMVTHNPNLAVVCDAEQIIHARFDRASDSTIRYESGAIENTGLNEAVVTILEGRSPHSRTATGSTTDMAALEPQHMTALKTILAERFVPSLPPLLDTTKPAAEQQAKQLSRAFSAFVLHKLLDITPQEAAASVVDDFNDKGIDAVHYDEDSETLYLLQTKLKASEQFKQEDALPFCEGIRLLIRQEFAGFSKNFTNRKADIEAALDACSHIKLVVPYTGDGISKTASDALQACSTMRTSTRSGSTSW